MSVYKSDKSRYFQFDFQFRGDRFHGSTGVETRRAAEAVERKLRQDAALGLLGDMASMTLDQGTGRWWSEVGQRLRTARDVERRLEVLLRLMGKNTRLVDISTKHVSRAIEARRGETYRKSPAKGAKAYELKNATVNADIILTLRRILQRAHKVWEVKGLNPIDWSALHLPEPAPKVQVYTDAQQAAWLGECDETARFTLQMLLTYGLRFNELFFPPEAFDPDGPRLVLNLRKGDVPHVVPLREDDARQIAARVGRAIAADLPVIWFEENPKGALVPVTYHGLHARLLSAARRAKVSSERVIHGARHHAGTTMLRRSKNLKLTQALLGHASIQSTMRYAHALEDDLRAALADESRDSPGAVEANTEFVVPKQRRRR
jgi:integrase